MSYLTTNEDNSWHLDESLEVSIAINQCYQELLDKLNRRIICALQRVRQVS
jgi:hypothetical protein